jgi:hypothetical protein
MCDKGVDLTAPSARDMRREAPVSYRIGDMVTPTLPEVEGLAGVIRELAASIRGGRTPLTDGESGLRVLRVLDIVPQSLAAGGAVVALESPRHAT